MTLNTRLTTYFIVALSLFGVTKAYSQQFFTFDSNSPRGGDVLIGERIHLDSIADLFHSRLTDEKYLDSYYVNGNDSVLRIFRCTRYQYRISRDSLLLLGSEDNLRKHTYSHPRLERLFPLERNKYRTDSYEDTVNYCNSLFLKQTGTRKFGVTRIPYALLPSGDTLKHAIILSIDNKFYTVNNDSSTFLNEKIQESSDSAHFLEQYRYLYALGYRYPIVESYQLLDADNREMIAENAYYYSPDYQLYEIDDEVNKPIREHADELPPWTDGKKWSENEDDISKYLNTDFGGKNISLSFTSDSAVLGMLVLSDASGRVYRSSSFSGETGEEVSASINYAGLRKGAYVIHVKINSNVYKCTFYID